MTGISLTRRAWHRAVGMALVPLGLLAALTGLWMAHFYPWSAGDGEAVYVMRLIVGAAMMFSIVRGIVSLLRHEHAAHGAWMLRGYALGMGAGTQVLTHLPWFLFVGGRPGEGSRAVTMGLAWISTPSWPSTSSAHGSPLTSAPHRSEHARCCYRPPEEHDS